VIPGGIQAGRKSRQASPRGREEKSIFSAGERGCGNKTAEVRPPSRATRGARIISLEAKDRVSVIAKVVENRAGVDSVFSPAEDRFSGNLTSPSKDEGFPDRCRRPKEYFRRRWGKNSFGFFGNPKKAFPDHERDGRAGLHF